MRAIESTSELNQSKQQSNGRNSILFENNGNWIFSNLFLFFCFFCCHILFHVGLPRHSLLSTTLIFWMETLSSDVKNFRFVLMLPPTSNIMNIFFFYFFYLHLHCLNAEYILAFNVRLHINCDRRWFFRLIEWWYWGNCICIEQTNLIMLMAIHFGLCIMLTIDSLVSALRNATMFESNTIPLWQVVKLTEIRLEIIFLNLYSGS